MVTRNDIISQLNRLFNEWGIDKTKCYIRHGAAMVMQGILEETNDIDLYVTKQVWDRLLVSGLRYETLPSFGDIPAIDVITLEDIQIIKSDMTYGVLLVSNGIQYTSILDTLQAKLKLNRAKDQDSIRKLRMIAESAYGFTF